jgi:hypothetical protein
MIVKMRREMAKEIIKAQKGKFFTAYFNGVKGGMHTVNGRTGVTKFLRGGKSTSEGHGHLLTAFSVQKMDYRNIHLDGCTMIVAGGTTYVFD